MTRKDYVAIAAGIAAAKAKYAKDCVPEHAALYVAAQMLAATLAADNPRFDRAKFLQACGVN